jgi:hypothetical protein
MNLLTNGSMYFDPRIHTLPYIRSHSSFLLCTILTISSSFKPISPSPLLHSRLVPHLTRLEHKIRTEGFKSIEIIQALLLLASWSEVPVNLARDKTWTYISHALALAVELRLDTPVPYYVQVDPGIAVGNRELFVRNAVGLPGALHERRRPFAEVLHFCFVSCSIDAACSCISMIGWVISQSMSHLRFSA